MTNANRVNVRKGSQELVHVEFNLEHWHWLLELGVVTAGAVDSFGDVFQYKVQVDFVFLLGNGDGHERDKERTIPNDIPCRHWSRRMP